MSEALSLSTRSRWSSRPGFLAIAAAPFAVLALIVVWEPTDTGPTVCPFALCTGNACPGCGMLRAAGHLVRGNIGEAIRYHPLAPLVLGQLIAAWALWLAHSRGWIRLRPGRWLDITLAASAVLLIGVWILRMLTGTLPPVA